MHGEHVDTLLDELACLPKVIGVPITTAWNAKEDLLATARSHPDREHVHDLLHRFYRRCADAESPSCIAWPRPWRHGGRRSSPS
jgi:transposase